MYKSYIFLNIIIIAMILLFAWPLSAQKFRPSNNAPEGGFHRSFKYHVNQGNRNRMKAYVKAKNKFQYRNMVQETQEGRHDHKDSADTTWLKSPDIFPGVSIKTPSYK